MPPEILIVGGGPSGLILALSLLRHGIPIRIIENCQHPKWNPMITPRSLELFKALGIIDDVLDQAILVPPMRVYNVPGQPDIYSDFEVLPYVQPTSGCPFLTVVVLSPTRLRNILHAALARMGCSVEHGTELVSFQQFYDIVNVKLVKYDRDKQTPMYEDARYAWVIGTDQASRAVCELLGFKFIGEGGRAMAIGEVYVEGLSEKWHLWGGSPIHHVGLRWTGVAGLFSFTAAGRDIDPHQLCKDKRLLVQLLREDRNNLKFGDILWSSVNPSHARIVDKLLEGRVMVAGVSSGSLPVQSINIDMQDSFNLGWKLALVHKNVASYSLLNSYSEERLSVLAGMIGQATTTMHDSFRIMASDYFHKCGMSGMGANYRWSSIVFDERRKDIRERAVKDQKYYQDYDFDGNDAEEEEVFDIYGPQVDGLRAGDRAPDVPRLIDLRNTRRTAPTIKTWHLFQIFGPTYHTVLVFAAATCRWAHVLKSLAPYPRGTIRTALIVRRGEVVSASDAASANFVLEDSSGYAHETYVLDGRYGVVVVRPDGVVGAIAQGVDGMHWYLHGIFTRKSVN